MHPTTAKARGRQSRPRSNRRRDQRSEIIRDCGNRCAL